MPFRLTIKVLTGSTYFRDLTLESVREYEECPREIKEINFNVETPPFKYQRGYQGDAIDNAEHLEGPETAIPNISPQKAKEMKCRFESFFSA